MVFLECAGPSEVSPPVLTQAHVPSSALPDASTCLLGDSGPRGMNAWLWFLSQVSPLGWDFRARPQLLNQLHLAVLPFFGQSQKPRERPGSDYTETLGQASTAERPASAQPSGFGGGFLGEDNTLKTAGPLIPSPALANPLSLLSQTTRGRESCSRPPRGTILGCHFPSSRKVLLHALLSQVSICVPVPQAPGCTAVWACPGLPRQTQLRPAQCCSVATPQEQL